MLYSACVVLLPITVWPLDNKQVLDLSGEKKEVESTLPFTVWTLWIMSNHVRGERRFLTSF